MASLSYYRKSLVRNELRRRGGAWRHKSFATKGLGQNLRQYRDGFRHRPRKRKGKQKDSHNWENRNHFSSLMYKNHFKGDSNQCDCSTGQEEANRNRCGKY